MFSLKTIAPGEDPRSLSGVRTVEDEHVQSSRDLSQDRINYAMGKESIHSSSASGREQPETLFYVQNSNRLPSFIDRFRAASVLSSS